MDLWQEAYDEMEAIDPKQLNLEQRLRRAEVKALQEKPVPAAELEKAKNLLLTDALRERETNNGKAFALGQAIVLEGDPAAVNRSLTELQAVTAADVQRVMRKWFGEGKPVVLSYVAAEEGAE